MPSTVANNASNSISVAQQWMLDMYTRVMDLNYWSSTECISAIFDQDHQHWNVTLDRDGEQTVLYPKQLIMATGAYGAPRMARFPGEDNFKGITLHTSAYEGGTGYKGKKCAVIGSGSSAHDVCVDLWDFGEDNSGLMAKAMRTAYGYYLDVGANQLNIDGEIEVKSGVSIERIESTGLAMSDDTLVEADVIIHATGYSSLDETISQLISPEFSESIGPVWGYGSGIRNDPGPWEGELRKRSKLVNEATAIEIGVASMNTTVSF